MSTLHSKYAEKVASTSDHHDLTFWNVRAKRDLMAAELPEWEQLRQKASDIKTHVLDNLESYICEFTASAARNGVHVHAAKDAEEYNRIVLDILRSHGVKKVVKSKSMLTEECHLNENLKKNGLEVVETDLAERILQMMDLRPSHVVMPALHVKKEDIRACFKEKIPEYDEFRDDYLRLVGKSVEEVPESDPTMLTYIARRHLRNHFLSADAGMTGANFGIARTGDVVVCTNEGNADMSTACPPLHIVSMGIEKVIPDYEAMGVFHRLLARCGTGQPTTVYTSHFRGPRPGGEMHIVLVDNGRREILKNREHYQTLKCMRCGACMNTCPVYRRSTGYSYTYFIPGPIGVNLGMAHDPKAYSDNVSACTLCMSCDNVCPVKVNLSSQIYLWRQKLDSLGRASGMKRKMSKAMRCMFTHPNLYHRLSESGRMVNGMPSWLVNCHLNPWAEGHRMMKFPKKPFHALWNDLKDYKPKEFVYETETDVCETKCTEKEFSPIVYDSPLEKFISTARTASGAEVVMGPAPEGTKTIHGDLAVAENGCIWIPQRVHDRSFWFKSEHLDITVSKKRIVSNMHEAYAFIAEPGRYFKKYKFGTFMSGPSKTADIEGALVYGAQAARSVTVYITD